ncbi:hypothetical protein C0J52_03736 [Blattella germanica]|nr:hypothetical protein C0J52_03736 [Blattella germanica]
MFQRTTLIFPYVYTGCYSIIIYREGNCDKPLGSTLQKYIATDYNKTLHINVMPFIQINWSAYEKQLSYYIWNITKQNLIKISTFLQSCGNNSNPDISTLCLNEIACDIQLYSNEDKVIKCKVNATNLPIDVFYRVTVAFSTDSSCKPILNKYDQVWKRSTCTYSSQTSYAYKFKVKPLDTVPSRSNMIPIAWGLSVAVVAIIFLCVSFICYLRRVPIENMSVHLPGINNEYQPKEHMSKILLLYPRDCVKFMEAMVALRNVLKHSTKCEVVDLYDKELEETISKNKTDWLQNIMQNTDVKIVLIETECAVLHQKALLGNFLIDYADYHWLNDLFMIEGFKNQNDSLSYVTPRRRYMIPQYTKELLKHICLPNNMNNSCNESTEKSELINNDDDADNDDIDVMKKLEECVKELQCNKVRDPAYLKQIVELRQVV